MSSADSVRYSLLSDKAILELKEKGSVVIQPFNSEQLGTNSYDVRLGGFFIRETELRGFNEHNVANPYSLSIPSMWGSVELAPLKTELHSTLQSHLTNIKDDERVILLRPGESFLGHTMEKIGGKINVTTTIGARSSMGRSLISICNGDSFVGDIGYVNCWCLEIRNNSRFHVFPLVVGERIAQITFYKTDG